MRHWIFSCKKTSAMISESMDRQLPLSQRMGLRFHLMMCRLCSRYQRQLCLIRDTLHAGSAAEQNETTGSGLSPEGRERIKKNLLEETERKA